MNNDVNILSDFYKTKINPSFILQESFSDLYKRNAAIELQEWYENDLQCLNQLLVQEGLGDALKSVGQKIGGAVKGVGDFAMKKLATALGKILKMAMPSEEEAQKLEQEVQKLQSDKGYLDQQAAAGQKLLGGGGNEASEEMYESTRDFLLSTVFSEANLREFFKQSLLTEAKAGRPKGAKTGAKGAKGAKASAKPAKNIPVAAGGFQKNSVNALDTHINDLVKIINGMKGGQKRLALNRIARSVGKQTKLEFPQPFPRAQKQAGQGTTQGAVQQSKSNNQLAFQAANQMATQDGQVATQGRSSQTDTETGQPQLGQGNQQARLPKPDNVIDAEYTDIPKDQQQLPASSSAAPEQSKGLFQKITSYVKAHPRLTSAIAIALIAAVTAASGGTMLPLVISGMSGATIKGGLTALQTKKEGGKVDWNKVVDSAFTGGAKGVGVAAAGEAIGGIAKHFTGAGDQLHDGGLGDQDSAEAQGDAETHDAQYNDTDKHEGGLGDHDSTEAQTDAETHAAQYPSEVDDNTFKKFNATDFNPKSPMDQAKKAIMQKLSNNNSGNIPSGEYNNLAKQAAALVRKGIKPNDVVRQLMGESYTAKYLRYF